MTAPVEPPVSIVTGSPTHRLIRGVLGVRVNETSIERIDVAQTNHWTASIVDSGDDSTWTPPGDTAIHMLWQRDEAGAAITVDGERFPIAPGDTMGIPGGSPVILSAGMLFARIEATSRTIDRVLPPSHGTESFKGYNRRTDYDTPVTYALQRWKITQPLTIAAENAPLAIISLATPLALVWSGGTDLIGPGECRVIHLDTGDVTLLPDGLGYALVVR